MYMDIEGNAAYGYGRRLLSIDIHCRRICCYIPVYIYMNIDLYL